MAAASADIVADASSSSVLVVRCAFRGPKTPNCSDSIWAEESLGSCSEVGEH